jgi:hypothetical protein
VSGSTFSGTIDFTNVRAAVQGIVGETPGNSERECGSLQLSKSLLLPVIQEFSSCPDPWSARTENCTELRIKRHDFSAKLCLIHLRDSE